MLLECKGLESGGLLESEDFICDVWIWDRGIELDRGWIKGLESYLD